MIDRDVVAKLAKLTRIEISSDEEAAMVADLESILGYVSELSKAPSLSAETIIDPNVNRFREDDNPLPAGFYTDKLLAEAPRTERGYILVKQVIAEKGERK